MSKNKKIPKFKTEAEERKFWEANNSDDYVIGIKPSWSLCLI